MAPPAKFSPADDEQLIGLVSGHSLLWNMADMEFKNTSKKEYIWKQIGQMLDRSGVECKTRWRSIRDYYKKQKKEEKTGGIVPPAIKRRSSYWNSLQFLDAVEDDSSELSNTHVDFSEDVEVIDPSDFLDSESGGGEAPVTQNLPKRRKIRRGRRYAVNGQQKSNGEEHCNNELGPCQEKDEIMANDFDIAEQLEERKWASGPNRKSVEPTVQPGEDEIDLFFRAMAATVKNFSPDLRTETKVKVFNIVTDMEYKNSYLCRTFPEVSTSLQS